MPYLLSSQELDQLHAATDLYRTHVDPNEERLPQAFKLEDAVVKNAFWFDTKGRTPALSFTVESFKPDTWLSSVAGQSASAHIQDAVSAICTYQTSRWQRMVGAGRLKDPTNLVCEQLKHWLLNLARSSLSDPEQVKSEIRRYLAYIRALEQSDIFPTQQAGSVLHHTRTMQNCLSEVAVCLERECQRIDSNVSRYSIRDVFANITKLSQSIVNKGIQFLFKILQKDALPIRMTREDAKNAQYRDLDRVKETRVFKLTKILATSEIIKAVNNEVHDEDLPTTFTEEASRLSISRELSDKSSAVARETNAINRQLGGNLIPDRHVLRKWWGNVHSGIVPYFQHNALVLNHFVQLHVYIEQLALFGIISGELESLADFLGSYQWATVGKHILAQVQLMYEQLQHRFLDALTGLAEQAQDYYSILSKKNETKTAWCRNFRESKPVVLELTQAAMLLKSKVECLQIVVSQNASPRRVTEMRARLTNTMAMMNQFCLFNNIRSIDCLALTDGVSPTRLALDSPTGSPRRQLAPARLTF